MTDTDLELAMQGALIHTNGGFTGRELIGEIGDVSRRLLAAMQERGIGTVQLPGPTPDDWNNRRWEVQLTDSLTGSMLTGSRAGEVCIRRSDGRISVTSVPSILTTGDDARRLAAALLAVADAYDNLPAKIECPGCQREFDMDDGREPVGMCRRCAGV